MSSSSEGAPAPTLAIPERGASRRPRRRWRWLALPLMAALVAGGAWAWATRPTRGGTAYLTETVDRGDLRSVVVESGSVESASNTVVRCQVEALVGMVTAAPGSAMGGTVGGAGGGRGGAGGGRGGAGGGMGGGRGGAGGFGGGGAARPAATAGATGKAGAGAAAGAAGRGGAATATASTGLQKPMIRSFTYMVTPHMPLRPALTGTQGGTMVNAAGQAGGGRGGAGGGGGGGGGFGGERSGSTRILRILPEGSQVKEGEVVCWLDDAAFRDELQAQLIRWEQAKSWVEQAERILEVSQISLEEYRDGIYPQDVQLIEQYIASIAIQQKQARQDLEWSRDMFRRNLYAETQVTSREYAVDRWDVAMREAEGMRERLVQYTGPKILRNLEAKIAAVTADLQAQKAAFALEDQRKRRLERAIAHCELKAPRDGTLVYVNESNGWGRTENQIAEGVAVRENQPIFQIPDLEHMRVRVKVNEAKVALLTPGTRALIRIDAFPHRVMRGTVSEVTVIPVPANGPFSDVKIYYANVDIDETFPELRTGMSGQVEFLVGERKDVTRVPLKAVRWFDGTAFVALPSGAGSRTPYVWKPIELGMLNEGYAEVVAGLSEGDRVIADPLPLAPPTRAERDAAKAERLADARAAGGRRAGERDG
jgi:multidrug resistance efflux pump